MGVPNSKPVLMGMEKNETLQHFVDRWPEPGERFHLICKQLAQSALDCLQSHTKYTVSEVVTGGSIGADTFVYGKGDIDIVLFVKELKSVKDLETEAGLIFNSLVNNIKTNWNSEYGTLLFYEKGQIHICFKLCHHGLDGYGRNPVKVDILLALDILKGRTMHEMFDDMKCMTQAERRFMSVCFTHQLTDFVKETPTEIKTVIKLVKYWVETEVNIKGKVITPYCLEVILINRWKVLGSPENFKLEDMFEDMMRILASLSTIHIVWEDRYDATSYWDVPPVVLDPVNPYDNLCPSNQNLTLVMDKASMVVRRIKFLKS